MSPDVTRALGVHWVSLGRPVAAAASAASAAAAGSASSGLGKSGLSGCRRRRLWPTTSWRPRPRPCIIWALSSPRYCWQTGHQSLPSSRLNSQPGQIVGSFARPPACLPACPPALADFTQSRHTPSNGGRRGEMPTKEKNRRSLSPRSDWAEPKVTERKKEKKNIPRCRLSWSSSSWWRWHMADHIIC